MIDELFKFILIAGIITGFAFITYTNLSPKRKDKSIFYLNFFVLFFTLNNLQITLTDYNFIHLNFFERKLLIPFYALIIPAFYTFVTYYLKAENKVKSFVTISILLFALETIIRIVLGYNYYNQTNNIIVAQYAKYEEIINLSYTILLFLKVIYIFMQQSKYYQEVASYDNMKWLKKFLIYGFGIIFFWVFAVAFNFKEVLSPNIPVYYPLRFSSTLLVFWVAYYGFFKYNLLTERIKLRAEIVKSKINIVSKIKSDKDFLKIEKFILEAKKYLDPLLDAETVSKSTDICYRNITNIISNNTKMGFNDYVNSFRIEEAKIILVNPNYLNYTIEAISLECGFYSKAKFYRAFAKHTQTNPTEYRAKNS
jgi:AraC-like DNA-binding protein